MSARQNIAVYDGIGEFMLAIDKPKTWPRIERSTKGANDFCGGASWSAAMKMARRGWPEGRAFLSRDIAAASALTAQVPQRSRGLDVGGHYPDVEAYCAGEPANMVVVSDEQRQTQPTIRLHASVVASWNIEAEQLRNRAAAILSYADNMEARNWRVEVEAGFATELASGVSGFRMMVKRADEPLDLDRAAFVLLHAGFMRRLAFRWVECNTPASDECIGYGSPVSVAREENAPPLDIRFPAVTSSAPWHTPEAATKAVLGQLVAAGIVFDQHV